MKNNQPVTNVERELKPGVIIASRTDLKGIITYANKAFVDISGFTEDELLGSSHNVVRHPDMPAAAFKDLWDTVQAGKPWTGIVKNRCKNGDHYWVRATVTPVKRAGRTVEYMSVRVRPTREEVAAAETLYEKVNVGKASLRKGWLGRSVHRLRSQPIIRKLSLAYTALIALIMGAIIAAGMWNMRATVLDAEQRNLKEYYLAVQDKLAAELRLASAMAGLVAEMPDVQEAFSAGDRERLLQMLEAAFKRLKSDYGLRQLQFHQPPATSFLRVHQPEKFGDDLTAIRPTIVKANADRAPVTGLDIGAFGLGLRGLMPVFKEGRHLGSVEFGMSFDNTFFHDLKAKYGIDLALDLYRDGRPEAFASTLARPLEVGADHAARVKAGETLALQTDLDGVPLAVLRAPVRDYANEVVGVLQVVVDRSGFAAQLDRVRNLAMVAVAISLLVGLIVSWLIARSIARPLRVAAAVAHSIADGKYDNDIRPEAEDEAGQVLMAMQTMQSRLHYDVHTVQEALQENLRVRSALDKVRSCVTVSDRNNRLVYMNDAARSLFDEIGAHIRRENGEFVTDSLLGKNLAELFPDEGLRQTYRAELQETRESRLTAWGHTIRLVTTPVRDRESNYQGRVTQWIDITRELEEQERERERIEEERRTAAANLRLKVALDNVSSNVMVADEHRRIIYMNDTAARLFQGIEEDIRREVQGFEAGRIIGSNIDAFHRHPAHQQALLERMSSTHASGFEIAGHSMRFVANPVIDAEGRRLGTVVEWTDRTAEVAVEREIDAIVEAARSGDLGRRVAMEGKTGFFHQLAAGINALLGVIEASFRDIGQVMSRMADGDLTAAITADYEGTFGQAKDDVNRTLETLSHMVGRLRESADSVATASNQISAGNTNLSARTEQQAASLQETASSMEQLTSTVRNNADNAQQGNQLAGSARQLAERGGAVVANAVQAMEAINTASRRIAEIISVIDEIAFQTNLLALNASVEAARAGEQGRGFAVVATEVRNLASRSAAAAKEIKELIRDSGEKVRAGAELVNESGVTLTEIVTAVKKVGDIVAEIAAASAEQAAGIDQVNQAVTSMDELTQQNAALAEQTSAASASLYEKAQEMREMMGFFKVTDAVPTHAAPPTARPPRQTSASRATPTVSGVGSPSRSAPPSRPKAAPVPAHEGDEWEEF